MKKYKDNIIGSLANSWFDFKNTVRIYHFLKLNLTARGKSKLTSNVPDLNSLPRSNCDEECFRRIEESLMEDPLTRTSFGTIDFPASRVCAPAFHVRSFNVYDL